MANTWGFGPQTFDVNGGADVLIELRVPYRGTIRSLNIANVDGASAGSLRLYDSEEAARAQVDNTSSSSLSASILGEHTEVHRVGDAVTLVAGVGRLADVWLAYKNRDGVTGNQSQRLWGVLHLEDTGPQQVSLSMTIELPEGG